MPEPTQAPIVIPPTVPAREIAAIPKATNVKDPLPTAAEVGKSAAAALTGETPKTETVSTKTEPTTEAKKAEEDASRKFAELSKRERMLLEKERTLKESMKRTAEIEKKLADAKKDPLEYLKAGNLSLEDLIDHALNKDKPPTEVARIKTLEEKIANYEKQIAEAEANRKAQLEQQSQAEAIKGFKTTIEGTVKADTAKYELITAYGDDGIEAVFKTCLDHFTKTGEPLPVGEAAEIVETQIFESLKRLQKASKLKSLLGESVSESLPKDPIGDEDVTPKSANVSTAPPTLTNKITAPLGATEPTTKKRGLPDRDEALQAAADFLRRARQKQG